MEEKKKYMEKWKSWVENEKYTLNFRGSLTLILVEKTRFLNMSELRDDLSPAYSRNFKL